MKSRGKLSTKEKRNKRRSDKSIEDGQEGGTVDLTDEVVPIDGD